MKPDSPAPPVSLDKKPCGCVTVEYEGGRKIFSPCVPCGLMRVAYELGQAGTVWRSSRRRNHLIMAGNALAAVATTLTRGAKQRDMVDVVERALKEPKDD